MPQRILVAASVLLAAIGLTYVASAGPKDPADTDLEAPAASSAPKVAPAESPSPAAPSPAAPSPAAPSPAAPSPAADAPAPASTSPAPLVPPAASAAPAPSAPAAGEPAPRASTASAEDAAGEIAALRARVDALEAREAKEPSHAIVRDDPGHPPTTSFDASPWSRTWSRGFQISGYVQGQYQQSQLSDDQLDANGNDLNQNRFLVRRARLRFERGWDWAFAALEFDGNNNSGLAFGLRRAEASVLWRAPEDAEPPLLTFTVGLTDIPFGYELYEPNRTRLFLERTTGSRALFPGDTDFGARLGGAISFLRYAIGVYDGTPVPDSEPSVAGYDPTSEKDIMARFGVETKPADDLGAAGGVSFVRGTGFHPGSVATQDTLEWRDLNANGSVETSEITGVPGQAATTSKTFSRWALGVDAELRIKTPFGRGLLYGEAYVGSNDDRGLFVADPSITGVNLREVGWYVAYAQEITRYGILGFRVDSYNPNGDATTQIGANLLPRNQAITTYAPLVGLVLPDRARLVFEYDHVVDHEGITPEGVPTDLRNDQWALRLQVEM